MTSLLKFEITVYHYGFLCQFIQGQRRGLIIRMGSVWPTLILLNVSIALKGTRDTSNMSRDVRKPDYCICENKDADQLRGDREADQRLCFRYTDSIIPLLPKSEISSP